MNRRLIPYAGKVSGYGFGGGDANQACIEAAASYAAAGIVMRPEGSEPIDRRRALQGIPPDTRDLTGRFFGDPLPGRSALDLRGAA